MTDTADPRSPIPTGLAPAAPMAATLRRTRSAR